ncbi:Smr/MutS family protein [bacterium]|nr:Smr/MutS family protein [bacterium]
MGKRGVLREQYRDGEGTRLAIKPGQTVETTMPANDQKEAKRRAAMAALDYDKVLDAVAGLCLTGYGRDRVLDLYPSFEPDPEWTQRVDQVETLRDEFDRIETLTGLIERDQPLNFAGVRDLGDSLLRAQVPGSRLETGELLDIAQMLTATDRLREQINKRADEMNALQPFADILPSAPRLVSRIEKMISVRTGLVVDNATPELNRLRRSVETSISNMRNKLDGLIRRHSDAGELVESSFSVREDRYVLAVKSSSRNRVHGIVHGMSSSGNTVYIEPNELVAAGNEIRRLQEEEAEEVRRILRLLTDDVREHLDDLKDAVLCVGLLDSLQARAKFAVEVGAMRPAVQSGMLRLVEARHPLLVLRKGIDATVPLTLYLGRDPDQRVENPRPEGRGHDGETVRSVGAHPEGAHPEEALGRAFVITGPNAGGKTVLLKTLGLCSALIHAGIWPPVGDGTVVPPLDEWHVIIGDDQSLEGDLSSFTGHLEKLKTITVSPAPNKLVLVDEIAAGTDPAEGGPLAESFLEMAVERGWWTLVSTHMGELKAFAHKTDGVRNGSMQFNRETLSPTYVFQPDLPGSSYALEIAARVGMPKKVVKRARTLAGSKRAKLEDLIEELSQRLRGAKERERELEKSLASANDRDAKLQEKIDALEAKRDEHIAKATAEAQRILDNANRTLEHTVKQIREQQASKESILAAKQRFAELQDTVQSEANAADERRKKRQQKPKPKKVQKPTAAKKQEPETVTLDGPLEIGDEVLIGEGDVRGTVLALKKTSVQVATGSMKLWMAPSELRKVGRSQPTAHSRVEVGLGDEDKGPISTELKLIGKRAEEASAELEAYLEELALANLPYARIVHGKGTGTLRAMVQERLKNSPLVAEYRFGEPGEGGDGVTVVQMTKS